MNWLQSAAGSVQEIFYRWVQPSRDRLNGAICVGTCALYRRTGLEESGGFAQIGHSEDVHTGVNLMKVGYSTRYIPVVVSSGLCPDNLSGFLSQQYRWCAGSMSLLKDTAFHAAPLSINQRLCFFTGFLYYISTAGLFFGGPLAAVMLVWTLPNMIWPTMYLPLVAASWLTFMAWNSALHCRWNLSIIRVMMLYSAAHALAIFHMAKGGTMAWVPTGSATKGASLSTKIQRLCFGWLAFIETIAWIGVIRGTLEYGIERFWLSIALMTLATVILWPLHRPLGESESRKPPKLASGTPKGTWGWLSASMLSLLALAWMIASDGAMPSL